MNTIANAANAPKRIRKSKDLLLVSAITFLTLCVAWGPNAACWVIAIAAVIAGWVWLARRYPFAGWLTFVFFDGFIGGLIGYRAAYYRPRRWRR